LGRAEGTGRFGEVGPRLWSGTRKIPGQLEGQIVEGGQGTSGKKHTRAGVVELDDDDILNRNSECERQL
jgi:hypothetical protein